MPTWINNWNKTAVLFNLVEIRRRLIRIAVFVSILFILCFSLSENILEILRSPLKDQDLVFLKPTEPFFVHLKLAFFSAIMLSMPFILYHTWEVIKPIIKEKDRGNCIWFLIFSLFFFALGVVFCYYLIIPYGIGFLITYKTASLIPRLSVEFYIMLAIIFLLIFGVVFELPLIILFLTKIGIIEPSLLLRNRKYAILIIFILSAILTPPDVITQLLMGIPLTILYEVGILLSRSVYKKKNKRSPGFSSSSGLQLPPE
ncbi:twin-arginine translocase subunit TatC [bacterium]|nr:twin-arginine translocase subunit TatC [bacterium]